MARRRGFSFCSQWQQQQRALLLLQQPGGEATPPYCGSVRTAVEAHNIIAAGRRFRLIAPNTSPTIHHRRSLLEH
uniref:Uncharacterized protein n=1 Tax=Oryza meridionalis TaxID=40149 RepID=A0A0E0DN26_9ORYZ